MQSFIEKQFPVSKVSKESYKERMANNSQTLTGLGKWWGRKPLVLVRAAILGCLMPASDNPAKDMDIFLKIMSMDDEGLSLRKEKTLSAKDLYESVMANQALRNKYEQYFDVSDGKIKLKKDAPRKDIEKNVFKTKGYDEKIAFCKRPEQLENISDYAWQEINHHLHTNAHSLQELVNQLSVQRFGHNAVVGDCFCGGGSIPFEAARMGCNAFGSDLNPIAGLLTWADLNIAGATPEQVEEIRDFQKIVYDAVDKEITELGIEHNENGDRAVSYLYCVEVKCPECGMRVPMAPSWVIGKGTKTVAIWHENGDHYDVEIKMGANASEVELASHGYSNSRGLNCPHCGMSTPLSVLRHDIINEKGNSVSGLREWHKSDFMPLASDVFQERLYAVKYERNDGSRYYKAPSRVEIESENKIINILKSQFVQWQTEGIVPSMPIEMGYNTEQPKRERGWTYWHHLFTPRQILTNAIYIQTCLRLYKKPIDIVIATLTLNRMLNWNSKLSQWSSYHTQECGMQTFYNLALNTLSNYCNRSFLGMHDTCIFDINNYPCNTQKEFKLLDARSVSLISDLWITDPPYADAVNYHEVSEFFLSWDKRLLNEAFPEWYTDSKRTLAVRGDEHFSQTMIDIYSNLTRHMNDDGLQVVMFTHSDPAVWAQLALIMWKAGLTVTAAWNIATETDASGLKDGNYVKGTVLLVLRKQRGDETAFLDELNADIKSEVQNQIKSMQQLDDKEDPNFSDPDYVLAAYAASLKVLTSYHSIGEIDLDYELDLAIHDPAKSEVVKLIERAKKIAYDSIIPTEFDSFLWKELSAVERFYIKGLEAEKHGNYQVSTYQEYARGFGLSNYNQMMASDRANTARLKTPVEFAMRSVDVGNFEDTLLRHVLIAIHISVKDENPEAGLFYLKTTLPMYWESREMIKQLLGFMKDTKSIDTMPHWNECGEMAEHLYNLVDHDHV